jgi:hypothetical protein
MCSMKGLLLLLTNTIGSSNDNALGGDARSSSGFHPEVYGLDSQGNLEFEFYILAGISSFLTMLVAGASSDGVQIHSYYLE